MTVPAIVRMKLRCRGRRRYINITPEHVVVADNMALGDFWAYERARLGEQLFICLYVLHDRDDDAHENPNTAYKYTIISTHQRELIFFELSLP